MTSRKTRAVVMTAVLSFAAFGWRVDAGRAKAPAAADAEIPFDIATFYPREADARWLMRYDGVAWRTTDLVMSEPQSVLERLGKEWFCFVQDGRWHAVYGKYDPEADRYDVVLQYVATDEGFAKSDESFPEDLFTPLARALHGMNKRVAPIMRGVDLRFNQYVRRLEKGRIETWMLPGWQTDGRFVFGAEFRFVWDKRGRKVLEESVPEPKLVVENLTPEMKLLIPNDDADVPSVGQIFAMLLARGHVALAGVRNKHYVSVLVDVPRTGRQAWVQVSRKQDLETSIRAIREFASREEASDKSDP